jgi:DNA-binding MarR family transcriptional regulator
MQASISPTQGPQNAPEAQVLQHVHDFMKYVMTRFGQNFWQVVGEAELSMSQLKALNVLTWDQSELSLKVLGDRLGLSLPAMSRAVEGLVQRGLVTRAENADDRRMKTVRITDAGRELVDRLIELRFAGIEEFVETLSPTERANLAAALEPIVTREEVVAACSHSSPLTPRKDSNA